MDKVRIQTCIRCHALYPYDIEHYPKCKQGYMAAVCYICFPFVDAEHEVTSRYYWRLKEETRNKFDVVYFAQPHNQYGHGTGLIKIGFSTKPDSRVESLRIQFKDKSISIMGIIHGTRNDEQALHRQFEKMSAGHEWFFPGRALLSYIKRYSMSLEEYVADRNPRLMAIEQELLDRREVEIAKIWASRKEAAA